MEKNILELTERVAWYQHRMTQKFWRKEVVNYKQYLVLSGIEGSTGGLTPKAISALVNASRPYVSTLLNVLEKQKLVKREWNRGNRENVTVMLTPKGQKALDQYRKVSGKVLEELEEWLA